MLSVMCEVFSMAPITFGIAGYVLVSRDGAVPNPTVTPQHPATTQLTNQRAKDVDTPTDRIWKDR
jgi:hypothetical protein